MCTLEIVLKEDTSANLKEWQISYLKKHLAAMQDKPIKGETENDFDYDERLGEWLCDKNRRMKCQFIRNYISSLENAVIKISGRRSEND